MPAFTTSDKCNLSTGFECQWRGFRLKPILQNPFKFAVKFLVAHTLEEVAHLHVRQPEFARDNVRIQQVCRGSLDLLRSDDFVDARYDAGKSSLFR